MEHARRSFLVVAVVTLLGELAPGCGPAAVAPVDLAGAERSRFSPGGQDGVLEKIFELIEPEHRYLVDLGAGDGVVGSCSRNLLVHHGWQGLLIEAGVEPAEALVDTYADEPRVQALHAGIFPGDIEILFERAEVPRDLDLLIVGLEANDWYVWRAIEEFRPKVVQIGYNAAFVPPQPMVIEYHPLNHWDGSLYFGASIQSLYELGEDKGYELVYADRGGTTLYFVDRPYFPRFGVPHNDPTRLFVARPGFPQIQASTLWRYVRPDGTPWEEAASELVVEDVLIPRTFVVGER